MERKQLIMWFAKPQSLMRSTVHRYALTVGVRAKWCSKEYAMKVERSKKAMLEESPKCLHQLSGEAENAARRIESPEQACACLLQEYTGRKVVSEGIAPSRPDWQVVPSQSEKRDNGHSVRSRARGKRCDGPLQDGGTTGCKVVRRGMAELEPRWATKACLD